MRTALTLFFVPLLLAEADRFGLPACGGPDQELAPRTSFTLCHSAARKISIWAAHELIANDSPSPVRRPRRFRQDRSLERLGASDADYRNSGYARGHLVPAADLAGNDRGLSDSYLLSNAVPQNAALNSGKWRVLEAAIRRLARSSDFVLVFTGPVFCGEAGTTIGDGVAVPCQLFKVVVASRAGVLAGFAAMLPNDSNPAEPLESFVCTIAEVERRTGLDFFPGLPVGVRSAVESSAMPLP